MSKYFNLFSNCIIIAGFKRSIILDNQRGRIHAIPNSLSKIINLADLNSYDEIINKFSINDTKEIDNYFNWLIENELGFWCNKSEKNNFSNLNAEYQFPYLIENLILDFKVFSFNNFMFILNIILFNNIPHIQIRFFNSLKMNDLQSIISKFKETKIESVELVVEISDDYNDDDLIFLLKNELRLNKIIIYNSQVEKSIEVVGGLSQLMFIKNKIKSCLNCGIIDIKDFRVNQMLSIQSRLYNTCLYKKISIDVNGNIKNCPSMQQSFGNIKDTTLEEALNHPDFKKYWNVTKDMIDVCKDCEFRHICTDCRAYTERTTFDGEIDLSKPLKCGYNPYTNEWAEWSTNPLKEKAIEYYGMHDLVKKDA